MRRKVPAERLEGLLNAHLGLDDAQVAERVSLYGLNDIVEAPPSSWKDLLRDTLRDPMLWFLSGTAVLFAFLGDYGEAMTLAIALIPLVGMDAYLHRRTQASTSGLSSRLAVTAKVIRQGAMQERPARELVPGDLVQVDAGEYFPADGLVLAGENMQVDESALSGESLPVRKQSLIVGPKDEVLIDSIHWVAAGTRLLTGHARVRLAYTGAETLYGEIVQAALQGAHARTPLQLAVDRLVSVLLVIALFMCAVLAAIRLLQGHGFIDALLSAVTLAVAALPEEYPVALTFFLGAGVYRLAKRQALVRRAVVVENIGRVTCICSDKTGTMTEGRLVLAHCDPAQGLSPQRLVEVAALASRSESADPLDTVLLAQAAGQFAAGCKVVRTFPFTEARRCETVIWQLPSGEHMAAIKGAPETVLARTSLGETERAAWLGKVAQYAAAGHKVIACGTCSLDSGVVDEPQRGFSFTGLLAFEDPVREGVREAVRSCTEVGVRVIMVTGDHPGTAEAVAREIGLGDGQPRVVVMEEIEDASAAVMASRLGNVHAVARAVPAQKLSLVKALQSSSEIVAVTGDGVNDVPALQAADVGIAMGERGTRSAREVAAIVLLDDNFRTIVGAISEGRQLFRNLQLSFAYLLMVHIPLVLSAAIIPLAGYPLLYLPIHIVWLELLIHPTALLVFQERPPERHMKLASGRHVGVFGPFSWAMIALTGVALTAAVVLSYRYALGIGRDVEHARAIALAVLILSSIAITAALSRLRSWMAWLVVGAAVVSVVSFIQVPVLALRLNLHPLHIDDWIIALTAASATGGLSLLFLLQRNGVQSAESAIVQARQSTVTAAHAPRNQARAFRSHGQNLASKKHDSS